MSTDAAENKELRLGQLHEQAAALMDSVASLGPYSPTTSAPAWIKDLVARIATEVTHLIPEDRYFPDADAPGRRFDDAGSVSGSMQTMLDIRLLLALVLAATNRYSKSSFGFAS